MLQLSRFYCKHSEVGHYLGLAGKESGMPSQSLQPECMQLNTASKQITVHMRSLIRYPCMHTFVCR